MSKNGFEYYHIVKNEDAHPFSHVWEKGNGFIVAADGLGGSGSTVHRLSDDQYKTLADTLPGLILPEYYNMNVTFMTATHIEEAIRDMTPDGDGNKNGSIDKERITGVLVSTLKDVGITGVSETTTGDSTDDSTDDPADDPADDPTKESLAGDDAKGPTEAPPVIPPVKRDTPFDHWLEKQFASMIDDKPDTSALWGSRIAISRFVFYMLANPQTDLSGEEDRAALTAFIYKGMQAVADHYGLSAGSLSGQSVLPTTLVSIRFRPEDDGQMLLETVWAGDSRAYAFIPGQGMKQLSVDDEDESGSICNLFSMGRSNSPFATDLHYVAYRLPAKSAIFVCSDGVFDPYAPIDNIGVEAMFLEALKDADSFESLGEAWHKLYSPMQHDDTSVAFRAFGFDSFEEFKDNFLPAYDDVVNAYNGYHNGKKIYPIIMGEEEHPQIYVEERAAKRMEQIADTLAAAVLDPNAPDDVTITDTLRQAYTLLKNNQKCDEIKAFLDDDPKKAEEVFLYPPEGAKDDGAVMIRNLIDCARTVLTAVDLPKKTKKKLDDVIRKGDALSAEIEQEIRNVEDFRLRCVEGNTVMNAVDQKIKGFYNDDAYACLEPSITSIGTFFSKRAVRCINVQNALRTVMDCWDDKDSMENLHARAYDPSKVHVDDGIKYLTFFQSNLHFFEEMREIIAEYLQLKQKMQEYGENYSQKQIVKYQTAVQELDNKNLVQIMNDPDRYFTETARSLFCVDVDITCDELAAAYVHLFKNEPKFFNEVITALSTATAPTILDGIFNPGRLKLTRTFNSFDQDAVLENRKIVDAMLIAYENVEVWIA